jgi:hypothetical protein
VCARVHLCCLCQGAARLKRLGACFSRLRAAGAELVILSNGIESEIEDALTHTGLREHFTEVLGGQAQQIAGTALAGKPSMLARLVLERSANPPTHVVFGTYPPALSGTARDRCAFSRPCLLLCVCVCARAVDDDMDNYPSGSHQERCCWSFVGTSRAKDPDVTATLVAWPVVPADGISDASMGRLEALLRLSAESTWTGDGRRIAPTLPQDKSTAE